MGSVPSCFCTEKLRGTEEGSGVQKWPNILMNKDSTPLSPGSVFTTVAPTDPGRVESRNFCPRLCSRVLPGCLWALPAADSAPALEPYAACLPGHGRESRSEAIPGDRGVSSKTPESEAPPYLPGLHLLFQLQFLLQDLQQLSLHCAQPGSTGVQLLFHSALPTGSGDGGGGGF